MNKMTKRIKEKKELPYTDNFVASEEWVKESLRKGLVKRSREFYSVKSVDRLVSGKYFIELEKAFNI